MPETAPALTAPELAIRLRQQERVAAFGRFAMQAASLQEILDEASRVAAAGLDTRFGKVLEYEAGEATFLVRAGIGWNEGVVGTARFGGDLQSPAGYAFRTGLPVISNHLGTEQRFRTPTLLAEHNIRSAINVLIQAGDGERFGVLEGDSTDRHDFNAYDVTFLQSLANTLAVAVQAQRRQNALEILLGEKEALLLENQGLLHEKDLLMKEVHHRVKNSLQLVRSMLTMQSSQMTNPESKTVIEEAAARVLAIAAIHHRLYDGGSITGTDIAAYLRGLLDDMEGLLPNLAENRSLELDVTPFRLEADDVAPLGLIAVELVTNALKHSTGSVRMAVKRLVDGLEITVSDDGGGFPPGFDPASSAGLGMQIVTALAKAADGYSITIDRSVPFGRIVVRTGFGGHG